MLIHHRPHTPLCMLGGVPGLHEPALKGTVGGTCI